jgi:hypothetical protein
MKRFNSTCINCNEIDWNYAQFRWMRPTKREGMQKWNNCQIYWYSNITGNSKRNANIQLEKQLFKWTFPFCGSHSSKLGIVSVYRHDIAEILLKMALNTINQSVNQSCLFINHYASRFYWIVTDWLLFTWTLTSVCHYMMVDHWNKQWKDSTVHV